MSTGEVLAFIPARGGSRRLPRKNALPLGGKPLLGWTIEAALAANLFSQVLVSSDDAELLTLARLHGAETDERPAPLATDRARAVEVLAEYLARPQVAGRFSTVAMLLPTCPFRDARDLHAAFALLADHPGCFVVSVSEYDFPPEFACDVAGDGTLALRRPEVFARSTQTQSVGTSWHPNGAIYAGPVARFLAEGAFFSPPMVALKIPKLRSIDIDEPHHLAVAEALFRCGALNHV